MTAAEKEASAIPNHIARNKKSVSKPIRLDTYFTVSLHILHASEVSTMGVTDHQRMPVI